MVTSAFIPGGREGLGLVDIPGGDLIVEKEVVGGGREVAGGVVQFGGRVAWVGGVSGERGGGKGGGTMCNGGRGGSGAGEGRGRYCGGLDGEGLVERALVGGRITADAGDIGRIVYGDGLGVLVLRMVLLCVNLFVLFEVLGPLEGFLADLGGVRGDRGEGGEQVPRIHGA